MKSKKAIVLLVFILVAAVFAGCNPQTNYDGKVKVVFNLMGGKYQNSELPITFYYSFDKDTQNTIAEPTTLSQKSVDRTGYTLVGWYEGNLNQDGTVDYTKKWDFDTDKVGAEGITLFAMWEKDIKFTYNVCYTDDDGAVQTIGTYPVSAGDAFSDYLKYANKRAGYTALGFTDAEGNEWDDSFVHPGGETDVAVNVFVNYIKGEYAVVRTAAELAANRTKNIYLDADIDFKGGKFAGFTSYTKQFIGNGHTISNFVLNYSASDLTKDADLDSEDGLLLVSLFGNAKGASVKDVTFAGVSVEIDTSYSKTKKIIFAPLAMKTADTAFENVVYDGTVTIKKLPDNLSSDNVTIMTDGVYYFKPDGDGSTAVNCQVAVIIIDNINK